MDTSIPITFLSHAAEVLTAELSGSQVVRLTAAYAVDYNLDLPYATYPNKAPNKRTMLFDNLRRFEPKQQFQIIRELCDRANPDGSKSNIAGLKIKLLTRYSSLDRLLGSEDLDASLVLQTRHWLSDYPEVLKLFEEALLKHSNGVFTRNALDDIRLALEKLLHALFQNSKSLENQLPEVGRYIRNRGGSKELANMLNTLLDYFAKYQNTYIKHDDAVVIAEVDVVLELAASFMKHLIRIGAAA